jgi:polysaccharide biosynthesis/export protein
MRCFFSLVMIVILMAGCSSTPQKPVTMADAAKMAQEASAEYKLGHSDILEVTVYGEESLNRSGLVVRPDGKISFPLIGDLEVGGLTTTQAKEALEEKLREYIPGAVAAISVMQLGSLQYYVVGKVNRPGMYNVSKQLTVLQALAMAGGLTPFADESKILVLRNVGAETMHLPFNYKKITRGENIEENYILQRGDVVVVP